MRLIKIISIMSIAAVFFTILQICDTDDFQDKSSINEEETEALNSSNSFSFKDKEEQNNDYQIADKVYDKNNVNIKYPQITDNSNLPNIKSINKVIEEEALSIVDDYLNNSEDKELKDINLDIKYKVTLKNSQYISIVFEGQRSVQGGAYPVSVFYTINIDLNKGTSMRLADYADVNDIADRLKNFNNAEVLSKDKDISKMQKLAVENMQKREIWNILKEADFSIIDGKVQMPQYGAYSYLEGNNIVVSIEVNHAIGDHAEFIIKI